MPKPKPKLKSKSKPAPKSRGEEGSLSVDERFNAVMDKLIERVLIEFERS